MVRHCAQHHYFGGITDCRIMLVAKTGGGDFEARLKVYPAKIPALALVRVYGKITSDDAGVPQMKVEFVRVWPWLTFTFADQAFCRSQQSSLAALCASEARRPDLYAVSQ